MNSDFSHDMYYDNAHGRSPGVNRLQPQMLHRQPSRQFDAYGQLGGHMSTSLYANPPTSSTPTIDEHNTRFEAPRYGDRLNATMHGQFGGAGIGGIGGSSGVGVGAGAGGGYDMSGLAGWNASAFSQSNSLAPVGSATTARFKSNARGRAGLPPAWLDQPQPIPPVPPFPALGNPSLVPSPIRGDILSPDLDDELIPTAIVIKNIPFAVKKEQLVQLMTDLRLPLPYAFNYHFDNGVFRGLAFANFTTADETAAVIETMNHFELQGRKLRVEYKKMLPLAERERIEREKRERRGQLEEQHRPMPSMHNQPSMSSLSSHMPTSTPSPLSARGPKLDYDLNDPQVLQFYSQLLLFKEDASRDTMSFPSTLTPQQRRIVHTLAHQMGLMHLSKGTGEQRQVHIIRTHEMPNLSPPISQLSAQDSQRRALSRAATTDFSDVRGSDMFNAGAGPGASAGALGRQSSGFLGFLESPGGGGGNTGGLGPGGIGGGAGVGVGGVGSFLVGQNLRAAKSFADLRSYTPSPVPSTASFPATLSTNFSRFNDHGLGQQGGYGPGPSSMSQGHGHTLNSAGAGSSNTGSLSAGAVGSGREEEGRSVPSLVNGLSNMTIGPGFGPSSAGSPRGLRGVMSWDRDHWEKDRDGSFFGSNSNNNNSSSNAGNDMGNINSAGGSNNINGSGSAGGSTNPGPIGGHRSMSMHFDEHNHHNQSQPQHQSMHQSFAPSQQSQQHHSFTSSQQHQQHSQSKGSGGNSSSGASSARLPGERTLGHQSSMPLRQPRGPPGILSVHERGTLTGSSSSSTLKTSASTLSNSNTGIAIPTGSAGGISGFGSGRASGLGVVGAGLGSGSGSGSGSSNISNNNGGNRQQQQNGHSASFRLRGDGAGDGNGNDENGSSSSSQQQNQQKGVEIVVE